MKAFLYVLFAISVAFALGSMILLAVAFSSQDKPKKYKILGYTSLGVFAITLSVAMGLGSKATDHYVKLVGRVYGITQTEDTFIVKRDLKTNELVFYMDDDFGEKVETRLVIENIKVYHTNSVDPVLYRSKEMWEMCEKHTLILPTYTEFVEY